MKRAFRLALALMCLLLLVSCSRTDTVQHGKEYQIAIVQSVDHPGLNRIAESLETALRTQGETLDVHFQVSFYNGMGDAAVLKKVGDTIAEQEFDAVVPIGTEAAKAMKTALRDSDAPMVFCAVSDPVGAGILKDQEQTDRITGTVDALEIDTLLEIVLAADPRCDHIGLLYSEQEAASKQAAEQAVKWLDKHEIRYTEATDAEDETTLLDAADTLIRARVDAIVTPTDNGVQLVEPELAEKLCKARIPHYGGADSFALNGALLGYGADYEALGKQTAEMVAQILTAEEGAKLPPVQIFESDRILLNTETAETLRIDLETLKTALEEFDIPVKETETFLAFP